MKRLIKDSLNHEFFDDVQFETSAARSSQFPTMTIPEIAIVGRSNVGKSSVINCIFNRKKLAYTAKNPGKTRLLNFFAIKYKGVVSSRIVDLPGYGYAKVDKSLKKSWEKTLLNFIWTRQMLVASLMITDCRRPLTDIDELMLDILIKKKIRYHILLNKSDKLNHSEKIIALKNCNVALEEKDPAFKNNGSCSLFSATKRYGLEELRFKLMAWLIK